jgi:uncharacterized membrane protein HdeD (DUF308 family)
MGIIFIILGILFIALLFTSAWWMVFYGVPLVILGIVLLLHKNEDKIERRKDLKEKVYKK